MVKEKKKKNKRKKNLGEKKNVKKEKKKKRFISLLFAIKNAIPFFPILGGHDSTRALQSTPS